MSGPVQYKVTLMHIPAGEPSPGRNLQVLAWSELEELQVQSLADYLATQVRTVEAVPRFELVATYNGQVIAGMQYVFDEDPKVGGCAIPLHTYIDPYFRGSSIARTILRAYLNHARMSGCKVACVTNRVGPWKYTATYHRLTR